MDTAAIVTLKLVWATSTSSCRGSGKSYESPYRLNHAGELTSNSMPHTHTHTPYLLGVPPVLALGQRQWLICNLAFKQLQAHTYGIPANSCVVWLHYNCITVTQSESWAASQCKLLVNTKYKKHPHLLKVTINPSYSRQFLSSLPSLQSASPSQRHLGWIHSPEPHCISLAEHFTDGVGFLPQCSGDSSDWSWQSTSLSHTQPIGIHDALPHWNWFGPQEEGEQPNSSVPSPQSSSPLHTKFCETQRPLAQVNSRGEQVILPKGGKGMQACQIQQIIFLYSTGSQSWPWSGNRSG